MTSDLRELCGQFEQVMLASLWPASTFDSSSGNANDAGLSLGAAERDLFAQAFAAAFERAGGLGLGAELFCDLGKQS